MAERPVSRRDALRITAVVGASAALGGGVTLAVLRDAGLRRIRETRTRMGTVVTLTVVHADAAAARALISAAYREMERLEGILSRHRADTPLAKLNARGRLERPAPELVRVLRHAQVVSGASEGGFDVTVLPLLLLYERSFRERGRPPTDTEVDAARRHVDYRGLAVDDGAVRFETEGMAVTLDGIAKGFIVDRTVDVLVEGGADRVLVDAGGDMSSAGGGSRREPWTVGVQDPHVRDALVGRIRLGGDAIATSGDYMRSFSEDRRHHHILDPRSGRSPERTSSVSVVARTAMEADALSTALLVLGPTVGVAMLESTPHAEALVVDKDGVLHFTSGMETSHAG